MKKNVNPTPLTESEREEFIRLRAELEYIKAENEVIKKEICIFLCDEIALPEIWKSDVRKRKSSLRVYSRNVLSRPYISRMDLSCLASMLVILI